jgi:hypothetical protein
VYIWAAAWQVVGTTCSCLRLPLLYMSTLCLCLLLLGAVTLDWTSSA